MKVAVIIPTHNRASLLLEAIESVLVQSLPPAQIIVVDDGSTDDTAKLLGVDGEAGSGIRGPESGRVVREGRAFPSQHSTLNTQHSLPDPQLTYVYQENAFLAAARNMGMRNLSPEIEAVLFLDDDDHLLPDALVRLTTALERVPESPLAYGRPRYMGLDGTALPNPWGLEDFEGPDLYGHLMRRNFICTAGCVLLRRATLEAAGPWHEPLRSAEDWDMWLRLAEKGAPFARVSEPNSPVLEYRVHPESMSKNRARMLENERIVCERQRDRFPKGSVRRQEWETLLAERERRIAEAASEGVSLDEALLSQRHRVLRRWIERSGIAALYRRIPLSARLRLRSLLGVDRHA